MKKIIFSVYGGNNQSYLKHFILSQIYYILVTNLENEMLFGFSDESGDSFVYDADVVAFDLIGKKALVNKLFCRIWDVDVFIENLIHTRFH